MYDFLFEGDGRLGQANQYKIPTYYYDYTSTQARAQAGARGGAATVVPDQVLVTVFTQQPGRLPRFRPGQPVDNFIPGGDLQFGVVGWVRRANFNATIRWLESQGGYSLVPTGENQFNLTVRQSQYSETLRRLGLYGYELWPDAPGASMDFIRPARAQASSRGGSMTTIFGLGAVGYALGGPPGACIGAACGLLLR
jgi:hypothetical protein